MAKMSRLDAQVVSGDMSVRWTERAAHGCLATTYLTITKEPDRND